MSDEIMNDTEITKNSDSQLKELLSKEAEDYYNLAKANRDNKWRSNDEDVKFHTFAKRC